MMVDTHYIRVYVRRVTVDEGYLDIRVDPAAAGLELLNEFAAFAKGVAMERLERDSTGTIWNTGEESFDIFNTELLHEQPHKEE